MLAAPVDAAVAPARLITVSPADSVVLVDGLNVSDTYTVSVVRGGVTVGSATGSPAAFGALALELNHAADTVAGTFCWNGVTPTIKPGDEVHVAGPGVDDFVTVRGITVDGNPVAADGPDDGTAEDDAFTVSGTLAAGLDPAKINVFLRIDLPNPDPVLEDEGWRASSSDAGNTLELGAGGSWTATFTTGDTPVTPEVIAAARSPRVLEATYSEGAAANENTVAVVGQGDPIPDGCPPNADSAIGLVSPSVINLRNQAGGVTVSGPTESSLVIVRLDDGTDTVDKSADVSAGTWTAHLTSAELAALDGTITVTAEHSSVPNVPSANTRTVLKDLIAPGAPTALPNGGTFATSMQVVLAGDDGTTIRFTEGDGTQAAPTATSGRVYNAAILLSRTTTIKAIAVDAAGNESAVVQRTFTRTTATAPAGPTAPTGPAAPTAPTQPPSSGAAAILPLAPSIGEATSGARGGADTATARWRAPQANGAVRDGYEVRALRIRPGRSAKALPAVSVGPNATKLKVKLAAGHYRFQVRAVSPTGDGPWSQRSNKVVSR